MTKDKPQEPAVGPELQLGVVDVQELLGPSGALTIQHGARRYLLRLTRQNNLILTRDESAVTDAPKP